jgi:hypothetical protein
MNREERVRASAAGLSTRRKAATFPETARQHLIAAQSPAMKTYNVTLTEEQAHAVGYAIMNTRRNLLKDKQGNPDLIRRLEEAFQALDNSLETEVE